MKLEWRKGSVMDYPHDWDLVDARHGALRGFVRTIITDKFHPHPPHERICTYRARILLQPESKVFDTLEEAQAYVQAVVLLEGRRVIGE